MDTFFEQIVPIRKTGKSWAMLFGIWLLAFIICTAVILFAGYLGAFALLIFAGAIYGAFVLSKRLNVEYEYIITNGTFDVDKIIAKSSRKRVLSIEISDIERIEKFNPNAHPVGNYAATLFACDEQDPDAYFAVASREGKGSTLLVFSPDERMRGAIIKFLPKFIANSAFK